jgi:hypothetical protein
VAYWLDLFTIETWREFKQAGGQISGFRESRWVRVKKMQPGDRLLCYIVGLKRWVGVLKVVGDPWNGTEPAIWQSDTFPARVNVEIELELAPETGVPAVDLIPEMPMFDKLDGMRGWGAFFMGSPALWQDVDGDIVVKAIQSAIESPVSRPIPRSAMRKRPRTIETPDLGTVAIPEAEDDEDRVCWRRQPRRSASTPRYRPSWPAWGGRWATMSSSPGTTAVRLGRASRSQSCPASLTLCPHTSMKRPIV